MIDREAILRRFERWLDEALASEAPPAGIPEEILAEEMPAFAGADLYTMQAALTALTQEIKLQGRSFKQLSEAVAPVAELAAQLRAEEEPPGELLDALLEVRERLVRTGQSARRAGEALNRSNWISRLTGRDVARAKDMIAALADGCRLTADFTNETLERFDVREIRCLNEPFDPRRMHAIATERTARAPEGTVVEVFRPGYEWKGQVYRPAQVKVTRPPAEGEECQ